MSILPARLTIAPNGEVGLSEKVFNEPVHPNRAALMRGGNDDTAFATIEDNTPADHE